MSEFLNTSGWEQPNSIPTLRSGCSQADIDQWAILVDRVATIAGQYGWNKAEAARRAGMGNGTFSQWYSGKYNGRMDQQNDIIAKWLAALEEQSNLAAVIPTGPGFLPLRTAKEIMDTLRWAQMCPDLAVITLAAGNGKTMACRHYCSVTPHAYMATISPNTKTVHGMLVELCAALDVQEHNPAKFTRAIGRKLERIGSGTLLIIDEAQNLVDDAINQLRHFVDVNGCGVALVGNDEIYTRFAKKTDGPSFAQLKSRIGKRLKLSKPRPEDLQTYIAAWGVQDADVAKFLVGVGLKGGAIRQIDKTMKLATMQALGAGKPLSIEFVRQAWSNRDVEDMA
jgi:DNA transposition AAA+ family ATPase